MEERIFLVDKNWQNYRLDKFLSENIKTISRSKINDLIKTGLVKVDEQIKKPSFKLKIGQKVSVVFKKDEGSTLKPFEYEIKIVYEDPDIIVIDKPAGLVVHPLNFKSNRSVVNALIFMKKQLSDVNPLRPGVVHRLDKETTGIMVLAKNNQSHLSLIKQFQDRVVKKKYLAICWGNFRKEEITIDMPLKRDPKDRLKIKVGFLNSKKAITHIKLIENLKDSSLLSITPITGRMHQIRVHLKFLEHPIVGDSKYGIKDGYNYLFLHSHSLGIFHPKTNEFMEFVSPMPNEFIEFINNHKV